MHKLTLTKMGAMQEPDETDCLSRTEGSCAQIEMPSPAIVVRSRAYEVTRRELDSDSEFEESDMSIYVHKCADCGDTKAQASIQSYKHETRKSGKPLLRKWPSVGRRIKHRFLCRTNFSMSNRSTRPQSVFCCHSEINGDTNCPEHPEHRSIARARSTAIFRQRLGRMSVSQRGWIEASVEASTRERVRFRWSIDGRPIRTAGGPSIILPATTTGILSCRVWYARGDHSRRSQDLHAAGPPTPAPAPPRTPSLYQLQCVCGEVRVGAAPVLADTPCACGRVCCGRTWQL
jgi:hypothetical protein